MGVSSDDELERLYREQGDRMWRAVLAFAGDPEVASDAVAEVFAQALRRGPEIRDPARWLWRSVFKIAAGELKERGRSTHLRTEGSYEMEEPARELVAALAKLSEKQRAAVVLHYAADYPVKEIAASYDPATGTVDVNVDLGGASTPIAIATSPRSVWVLDYDGTLTRVDLA